ncbi:DM DNA binding domain containing protein [Aphelenchoides avenae]|nr:DM DNA binding domain containing protein [Aphelenchus avenae]
MVEHRRHLNSQLRQRKSDPYMSKSLCGKRVRHPKCARCGVHGQSIPLRGHKKTNCAYSTCTCDKCNLVEMRRTLMAKQVKLRREQQKKRKAMREQRPQFECELQGQQCAVANDGKTAIFAASSLLVGPVNNTVLNDMARPVPRNFVGFESECKKMGWLFVARKTGHPIRPSASGSPAESRCERRFEERLPLPVEDLAFGT